MSFTAQLKKPQLIRILALGLVLLRSSLALALGGNTEAAFIPLKYEVIPASDLIHQGQSLTPDQANALVLESGLKFDLSLLNPDESTDIWKNVAPSEQDPAIVGHDELPFAEDKEVTYLNTVPSRSGNFRFLAKQSAGLGETRHFVFFFSKEAHNLLLRKALLRKLGYFVPATKHVAKLQLRFSTRFDKEIFVKEIADQTFGDPKRWVVEQPKDQEDPTTATLQDVVVMEEQNRSYNLAMGYVPANLINNRRVFNSLIVPYSMVEVPESINQFSFNAGLITNEQVKLTYPAAEPFSCGYEDARWITRRILTLTREDFQDIAREGRYPGPVEKIVTEKLISRRNSLRKMFNLEGTDLPVNPTISEHPGLFRGKVTQQNWPGYASRFAFGDPTSPLSAHEITRYFGSEAIGQVIDNAVNLFNSNVIPSTNLNAAYANHQQDLYIKQLIKYLETGVASAVPVGMWGVPFWDAGITASRHVVAGTYMGTNNLLQLVDSIGMNVSAGGYFVLDGIQAPVGVSARAQGVLSRVYAHVKPLTQMRQALHYPFRNLFVPVLKHKHSRLLKRIDEGTLMKLPAEERDKQLAELLKTFRDNFNVGESLIITDTASAGGSFNLTARPVEVVPMLTAQVGVSGQGTIISRMHIFRASEDTIQIYKDLGKEAGFNAGAGVSCIAPIVSISAGAKAGTIRTRLYSLNLSPDLEKNPELFDNVETLEDTLRSSSLMPIMSKKQPFTFYQKYKEGSLGISMFFRQYDFLKQNSEFQVTPPTGNSIRLIRRLHGSRKGNNYQKFLTDTVNGAVGEIFRQTGTSVQGVGVSNTSTGDPGDSLWGKSASRVVGLDAEMTNTIVDDDGNDIISPDSHLEDPTVNISYRWKGWKISRKKALELLDQIRSKFSFDFFPGTVLQNIKSIGLYSFDVDIMVYEQGIEHAMNLSYDDLGRIIRTHWVPPHALARKILPHKWEDRAIKRFYKWQSKYRKAVAEKNSEKAASIAQQFFSSAEAVLTVDGLAELAGGKQNIYVYSRIGGFKEGAEDGDLTYSSDTIGKIGGDMPLGPINNVIYKTGILEGEFFGYWLLRRLQ